MASKRIWNAVYALVEVDQWTMMSSRNSTLTVLASALVIVVVLATM